LIGACGFAVIGACAKSPKVDSVPVGTEVQVTRADGGLVEGTLANRSEKTITIDDGKVPRTIARDDIRLLNVVDASKPAEVPVAARFREIRVPASTPLSVRLETTVSSKSSHEEDPITAVLVEPIVVDGIDVIPAGARLRGEVTNATPSAKVKGLAALSIRFTSLTFEGTSHPVNAQFSRVARATKTKDAEKIGIPGAVGAIIGGVVGGGKGAAAGAAIGGGAGTAVVLTTPGENIELSQGTVLSVTAGEAIDVRVPLHPRDRP
jgi:hypothetical protein